MGEVVCFKKAIRKRAHKSNILDRLEREEPGTATVPAIQLAVKGLVSHVVELSCFVSEVVELIEEAPPLTYAPEIKTKYKRIVALFNERAEIAINDRTTSLHFDLKSGVEELQELVQLVGSYIYEPSASLREELVKYIEAFTGYEETA
ncbi:hypothetical protein [Paenibacillus bouchesdurhonensis]|uniref:hypothetical protein n=1 Tax=Paenibacillus bouchesdurhonensis TaxID=1870990 RepID=UPI000DA6064F|nr:hypothetical protein [Paenibacillus bouchesdurhonensis]